MSSWLLSPCFRGGAGQLVRRWGEQIRLLQRSQVAGLKVLKPWRPLTPSLVLLPSWCPYILQSQDWGIGHRGLAAVALCVTEGKPEGVDKPF